MIQDNRFFCEALQATFQQKSAGLSLVITGSVVAFFAANAWMMRPPAGTFPSGYIGLLLTSLILLIVSQIVLQTVLVIGAGTAGSDTVYDQEVRNKATRNAIVSGIIGLTATAGLFFTNLLTPFDASVLAILSLALAEIVKLISRLVYGRA